MNTCSDKPSLVYFPKCDKSYKLNSIKGVRIEKEALKYQKELKIEVEKGVIDLDNWDVRIEDNILIIFDKKHKPIWLR